MTYKLLLFFCLYLPFQIALNPVPGVDLGSIRVLALFLALSWLFSGLKNRKIFIPHNPQTFLFTSFLVISLFSIFFSQNIEWSARKFVFLLSFWPLYFVVADIAREKKQKVKIVEFLVWGAGAASLVGIFQFGLQFFLGIASTVGYWGNIMVVFLGQSFSEAVLKNSSWLVNISGDNYLRATAFFPDPHMFSFYLGMVLPWSVVLYLKSRDQKNGKGFFLLLASLLILLANILTFSRGGYAGLIVGVLLFVIFFGKRILTHHRKLSVIIAFFLLLVVLPFNPASKRFFSSFNLEEGSNASRIDIWKDSVEVIKENPLAGVGLGNYSLEIKPTADYREPIYSHNLYLDIASEMGILNLIIWVALIIISIVSFIKRSRHDIFYLGGALALIIYSVHSVFETALFSIQALPLLIIILALGAIDNEKREI